MAIVGRKVIQKIPGILKPPPSSCLLNRQVIGGASSKKCKLVLVAAADQSLRSLMAKVKLEARENKSKSERESSSAGVPRNHRERRREVLRSGARVGPGPRVSSAPVVANGRRAFSRVSSRSPTNRGVKRAGLRV